MLLAFLAVLECLQHQSTYLVPAAPTLWCTQPLQCLLIIQLRNVC